MKLKLIGLAALTIGMSSTAFAASGDPRDCIGIANNTDRLACYDAALRPTVETAEAAEEKKTRWFGFSRTANVEKKEDFGKRAPEKDAITEISAKITDVTFRRKTAYRIVLDNGQIWEQLSGDSRFIKIKDGIAYDATVKKAAMGSFRMTIEPGGKTIRVRRVE